MRKLLASVALIMACSVASENPPDEAQELKPMVAAAQESIDVAMYSEDTREFEDAGLDEFQGPEAPDEPEDFYADAKSWCDPAIPVPCKTSSDCAEVEHPSGKDLKCVTPFYARAYSNKEDYKVCSPGWITRPERDAQRARLKMIIEARSARKSSNEQLYRFLSMVAMRETTLNRSKRHRLNDDLRANRQSWTRNVLRYKHSPRVVEKGGKKKVVGIIFEKGGNPYYREVDRWNTGLGLYGMNAAGFTAEWDPMAPPEVLCDDIIATEAYLRVARRALRKMNGGIDCDGDGKREFHGSKNGKPTLRDVHRAASGGKLCPGGREIGGVEARAKKNRVNLDATVTSRDFLVPLGKDGDQITEWLELRDDLDTASGC